MAKWIFKKLGKWNLVISHFFTQLSEVPGKTANDEILYQQSEKTAKIVEKSLESKWKTL